jgi:uncharacterized protein (DUF1330 family)
LFLFEAAYFSIFSLIKAKFRGVDMNQPLTYVEVVPEQAEQILAQDDGKPIHMINLIRFHKDAQYPEFHEYAGKGHSGADAYRLYFISLLPILEQYGGEVVWFGEPDFLLIGPEQDMWDLVLIVRYPSTDALITMSTSAEYQPCGVLRKAAVEDTRLMRAKATSASDGLARFLAQKI